MDEIVRHILLIPFILLTTVTEVIYSPDRNFQPSPEAIAIRTGRWEQAAGLPTQRYDFGSAVHENELYVVGGLVLPSPWFPTNRVEKFDPSTNTWVRIRDYPKVVHHNGVISCNGNLYVVGGYWLRIIPTDDMYMYDSNENVWIKKANLPVARGAHAGACLGNKIYVVGGHDGHQQFDSLYVYDTKSDSWERKQSMSTPREHLSVVAQDGRLFALGGLNHDRYNVLNVIESYTPETDSWETLAQMPTSVSGFLATVTKDSIFVIGGAQGDAVSPEVFEYKVLEDKWYYRNDMPVGRYGLAGGTIDGKIHVIGGSAVVKGNYFSQRHDIYIP